MTSLALYEDDFRRIYRPRIVLTEEFNRKFTDVEECERFVYMDFYIQPKLREERLNKLLKDSSREDRERASRHRLLLGEKADIPAINETLDFKLRKHLSIKDHETIRNWSGVIEDVVFGTVATLNEHNEELMTPNNFCGMVKVRVKDVSGRSLVINPAYVIKANVGELPA